MNRLPFCPIYQSQDRLKILPIRSNDSKSNWKWFTQLCQCCFMPEPCANLYLLCSWTFSFLFFFISLMFDYVSVIFLNTKSVTAQKHLNMFLYNGIFYLSFFSSNILFMHIHTYIFFYVLTHIYLIFYFLHTILILSSLNWLSRKNSD